MVRIFFNDINYILNEAVDLYLEVYQWEIAEIKAGVAEADAGDYATDEEVQAAFAKLINYH